MCVYIIGTGIYVIIYSLLVNIPYDLIHVFISLDIHYHPVCVLMSA